MQSVEYPLTINFEYDSQHILGNVRVNLIGMKKAYVELLEAQKATIQPVLQEGKLVAFTVLADLEQEETENGSE